MITNSSCEGTAQAFDKLNYLSCAQQVCRPSCHPFSFFSEEGGKEEDDEELLLFAHRRRRHARHSLLRVGVTAAATVFCPPPDARRRRQRGVVPVVQICLSVTKMMMRSGGSVGWSGEEKKSVMMVQ